MDAVAARYMATPASIEEIERHFPGIEMLEQTQGHLTVQYHGRVALVPVGAWLVRNTTHPAICIFTNAEVCQLFEFDASRTDTVE